MWSRRSLKADMNERNALEDSYDKDTYVEKTIQSVLMSVGKLYSNDVLFI